jgi:hypothetical protein
LVKIALSLLLVTEFQLDAIKILNSSSQNAVVGLLGGRIDPVWLNEAGTEVAQLTKIIEYLLIQSSLPQKVFFPDVRACHQCNQKSKAIKCDIHVENSAQNVNLKCRLNLKVIFNLPVLHSPSAYALRLKLQL